MRVSEFDNIIWSATRGRWMAFLEESGKDVFIGFFRDDLLAASAVNAVARERIDGGSKARYKFHRLREHFALRRASMEVEDQAA